MRVAPAEIVFTGGASESNNLALNGWHRGEETGALLTSKLEHKSVKKSAENGAKQGRTVQYVSPGTKGSFSLEDVEAGVAQEVGIVSLMWINNETGWASPVHQIAEVCRERQIPFHSDSVQAAPYLDFGIGDDGPDLVSLSAHKLYGPKGVGLLYVRGGYDTVPMILGGSQERNRRGGTENVAGIVGFARALELAVEEREQRVEKIIPLHRRIRRGIEQAVDGEVRFHSPDPERPQHEGSPHILSVGFPPGERPVDGEMLLLSLDVEGICVSGGSACSSGAVEPSQVLLAMGVDAATAAATIRISFGKDNSDEEVDRAVEEIARIVGRLRS
jgi:cysteine desulfurase